MKRFTKEFWVFGLKQASASIFGGALLLAILLTEYWPWNNGMHRFDMLFLYALCVQVALIAARLEEPKEIVVILVFHFVATLMELFKTSDGIGAWNYPGVEGARFAVWNVPYLQAFCIAQSGAITPAAGGFSIFDLRHFPHPGWPE